MYVNYKHCLNFDNDSFLKSEEIFVKHDSTQDTLHALFSNEIKQKRDQFKEDIANLTTQASHGNIVARQKLAEYHLPLVISIAKKYMHHAVHLHFLDHIQEGVIGLMTAIEKFDPDLGFAFSTYATPWIHQSIQNAISNNARTVRIPHHQLEFYRSFLKRRSKFINSLDHMPKEKEIYNKLSLTKKDVVIIQRFETPELSLDHNFKRDENNSFHNILFSTENQSSHANPEYLSIIGKIAQPYSQSWYVLAYRFGIIGQKCLTKKEVIATMNITQHCYQNLWKKLKGRIRKNREFQELHENLL